MLEFYMVGIDWYGINKANKGDVLFAFRTSRPLFKVIDASLLIVVSAFLCLLYL